MYVPYEVLVSLLQKRQPLPLSPQNYPLHGSEVNGFHSAPTTYNHTPAINGEGIMGMERLKCPHHTTIIVMSVTVSTPWSFGFFFPHQKQISGSSDSYYLFCLCSQPRHHSWQFRRWNWEGSCLSEFSSVCWFLELVLGNKTITTVFTRTFIFFDKVTMWYFEVILAKRKKKNKSVNLTKDGNDADKIPSVVYFIVWFFYGLIQNRWKSIIKHWRHIWTKAKEWSLKCNNSCFVFEIFYNAMYFLSDLPIGPQQ